MHRPNPLTILLLIVALLCGLSSSPSPPSSRDVWQAYRSFDELAKSVSELGKHDFIQLSSPTTREDSVSREGHRLWMLTITNTTRERAFSGRRKARVLFVAGEHARELFPVDALVSFMESLARASLLPCSAHARVWLDYILDNAEVFVVPLLNADGRRVVERSSDYCWRNAANGVDLNRNMDWEFESGSAGDEDYGGPHPFSEPETRFLRTVLTATHPHGFFSLHSGAREMIFGFSDTRSRETGRVPENLEWCMGLAHAVNESTSGYFTAAGPGHTILPYPADGTIIDYVAGSCVSDPGMRPCAVAVEMFGTGGSEEQCFDAFNPPPHLLANHIEGVQPVFTSMLEWIVEHVTGVQPPAGGQNMADELCAVARRLSDVEYGIRVMRIGHGLPS